MMMRCDSKRNRFCKRMSTTDKEAPSWSFSSLPEDIILSVLARVPRRYHPILSCVSKELQSLVRSSELQAMRSLRGKENRFYVGFRERYDTWEDRYHWFTFTESHHRLASIPFPSSPLEPSSTTPIMVGTDIYIVGGSRKMPILDTRSGKLRQGPKSPVFRDKAAVGLVNDKIYIFGGACPKGYYDEDIQAQAFDLNTQTWQLAPNPSVKVYCLNKPVVTPALGRKIYVMGCEGVIVYDTRDGTCDEIIRADLDSQIICVVDNVLYMHYHDVGLMWYEAKAREWRVVGGLKFKGYFSSIKMAECNGKLVFLWHSVKNGEVWCSMIALYGSSNVAIRGLIEWSDRLLSNVPFNYYMKDFMVCTDYNK